MRQRHMLIKPPVLALRLPRNIFNITRLKESHPAFRDIILIHFATMYIPIQYSFVRKGTAGPIVRRLEA